MSLFGLGKVLGESRALGTAMKVASTPGFQPQKSFEGDPITTSVNIYTLGGVLTELFGG